MSPEPSRFDDRSDFNPEVPTAGVGHPAQRPRSGNGKRAVGVVIVLAIIAALWLIPAEIPVASRTIEALDGEVVPVSLKDSGDGVVTLATDDADGNELTYVALGEIPGDVPDGSSGFANFEEGDDFSTSSGEEIWLLLPREGSLFQSLCARFGVLHSFNAPITVTTNEIVPIVHVDTDAGFTSEFPVEPEVNDASSESVQSTLYSSNVGAEMTSVEKWTYPLDLTDGSIGLSVLPQEYRDEVALETLSEYRDTLFEGNSITYDPEAEFETLRVGEFGLVSGFAVFPGTLTIDVPSLDGFTTKEIPLWLYVGTCMSEDHAWTIKGARFTKEAAVSAAESFMVA